MLVLQALHGLSLEQTEYLVADHIERLLAPLAPGAGIVTLLDGHPAALDWMGAVRGQRVAALGVDRFGQAGDIPSLHAEYGLDEAAILDVCAEVPLAQP